MEKVCSGPATYDTNLAVFTIRKNFVTHQAAGVNLPVGFLARFGQEPIFVVMEDRLAAVPSFHDVINRSGICSDPATRLFVNIPSALAAALDMQAGERLRWQLLNRSDLRLIRLEPPTPEKSSKK
jgi:hypothetical protein